MTFDLIVLSHYQARPLLAARRAEQTTATVSLDLGLNQVMVTLTEAGVQLPGEAGLLAWAAVEAILDAENACFLVQAGEIEKIQRFSQEFNRLYTLYPTPGPPTMLISGIPMHRIKGTDPGRDTQTKIRAAGPFTGPVLDTATGLGYTAIEAAQRAEQVTTIELDPAVLDICRLNPWSRALSDNPKIVQRIGDSADIVQELADEAFAQIIHDPPMFSLAGHLYSTAYYRNLHRILRPRGRLYHYIGSPDTKSGKSTTGGVVRRLQEAGFARVRRRPRAFGLIAYK